MVKKNIIRVRNENKKWEVASGEGVGESMFREVSHMKSKDCIGLKEQLNEYFEEHGEKVKIIKDRS
jgi:hypothetical protein